MSATSIAGGFLVFLYEKNWLEAIIKRRLSVSKFLIKNIGRVAFLHLFQTQWVWRLPVPPSVFSLVILYHIFFVLPALM
ncbi:hypothetical protein F6P82_06335 [Streptococcus suis]|nr:hypothetical protein [Streptococcus suis]